MRLASLFQQVSRQTRSQNNGIKGIARSATTKFCAEENAKEWHRMHQVNTHTNAGLDHLFYLINFALRP